ncbi:MAG TPA: ABC transporter permease, partial [Methylomirabilota bacterium]|nr:ABC transporter permease [Methylomirabilota bacterium]
MRTYVLRRLLLFVPTLVGASILIFVLMRLVPGDIAEILVYQTGSESSAIQKRQIQTIRHELGLDKPVLVQYLDWVAGAVRGDFGQSYVQRRPVSEILRERFPRSMELAVLTLLIALAWAIPLGVVSAARQNGPLDYLARLVSLSGLSLPLFFTGALILYGLVRLFRWLPPLEFVSLTENPLENLKQLIWPALAQAYYISAPITRLTRSQMLEVVRQDYVRTARAKGLGERAVVYRHALRNSLLPVVTFIGWWGGRLLGG